MSTFIIACVGIVFDKTGRILLLKRHQPNHHTHEKWNLPGGGIEFGEDPKDAVIREVKEEANISVKLLSRHPYVYSDVRQKDQKQILLLGYLAQYIKGEVSGKQDEGVSEAKWFTFDEIDFSQTLAFTKEMILDAKKHLQERNLL